MSKTYEVSFDPLTLGGSNYDSWSPHVFNEIRTFGPHAEQIIVASILPPQIDQLTQEVEKLKT
jgi:hypothetical protein